MAVLQVENMHLTSGLLFGLPIVFDTNDETLKAGDNILLKQVSTYRRTTRLFAHQSHTVSLLVMCSIIMAAGLSCHYSPDDS